LTERFPCVNINPRKNITMLIINKVVEIVNESYAELFTAVNQFHKLRIGDMFPDMANSDCMLLMAIARLGAQKGRHRDGIGAGGEGACTELGSVKKPAESGSTGADRAHCEPGGPAQHLRDPDRKGKEKSRRRLRLRWENLAGQWSHR